MWDFSRGPGASSKWRRVTEAEKARQYITARRLAAARVPIGDREALAAPVQFTKAEEAELERFLGIHARTLRTHIARCGTELAALRLAWLYRATLQEEPGAWPAWAEACRALDDQ